MARPHLASRLVLGVGAAAAIAIALPRTANAGGYDTPILYSARHMGMGGTAIGYVSDPSAMFHNPAGLNGIRGLEVMGNLSPLTGSITSSPGSPDVANPDGTFPSRTTEPTISPLFLVGAGYRLAEPVTFGIGVYPVAAAAGTYKAQNLAGATTIDKTRLVFLEISPGISVELMRGLSLGIGYRATIATLERVKGVESRPREFDFTVSGVDAAGIRAGLQWRVSDNFGVGVVYRHRVEPTLKADKAYAYADLTNASTSLVLPSKLGVGLSGKVERLHGALDVEYGFYEQNTVTILTGYNPTLNKTEQVKNYFQWQNGITTRLGLEYLLGDASQFAARVGYVFDGKVGNRAYPTAFGTPPVPSHSITVGGGYRAERWQTNLGFAYRFASTAITPADVAGAEPCASCSKPGPDYSLNILGFYLDFSYRFDVAPIFGASASAAPPAPETGPPAPPAAPPTTEPIPAPEPTTPPAPTPAPTT